MKLKVLVDNNTYIDQYHYGEPAVSYYIEDEDTKLLLDVGYSDLFIKNSNELDVDLKKIDAIVISHGHDDHTRGLQYYFEQNSRKNINIFAHPHAFKENNIKELYPCHCTSFIVKAEIHKLIPIREVGVGLEINW